MTKNSLLLLLLFITACASKPEKQPLPQEQDRIPIPETHQQGLGGASEEIPITMKPVVLRLLSRSQVQQEQGNFPEAVSLIERAINISPQNAVLWQKLAEIRLEQGNFSQARQLAKKSLSLGNMSEETRELNRQIIYKAEKMSVQ